MGSRWLVELPTRDTTGATSSTVSPESLCTTELRTTSRPEALTFSSSWRDAAAILNSEPDWSGMDTIGCWRAAKESKPVKCYLPHKLDLSTQALIEAQMEDEEIKDLCGWIQTASEPPDVEDVSPLGGTTRTYLRQWYIPEAVVGTEAARRLTSPTLGVGGRIASGVAMDTACKIQRHDHSAGAWRHDQRPPRCHADTGPVEKKSILE